MLKFFGLFTSKNTEPKQMLTWSKLKSESQLDEIVAESASRPILIYKHSTRCPVSAYVKNALEKEWQWEPEQLPIYYLDLFAHPGLSNRVAQMFGVPHKSPQLLLIRNGEAIFDTSHMNISVSTIAANL